MKRNTKMSPIFKISQYYPLLSYQNITIYHNYPTQATILNVCVAVPGYVTKSYIPLDFMITTANYIESDDYRYKL